MIYGVETEREVEWIEWSIQKQQKSYGLERRAHLFAENIVESDFVEFRGIRCHSHTHIHMLDTARLLRLRSLTYANYFADFILRNIV